MLQEALKAATKDNHDELENLMFVDEIMNKSLSIDNYRKILSTNYVVHKVIEPKIEAALTDEVKDALKLQNRFKLDALQADAVESDLDISELDNLAASLDDIKITNESALGTLYVLEGATLGGNVILKKLRNTPGFEDFSLSYYAVYKDQLMNNWMSFVQTLNSSGADSETVVEGAKSTFDFIASVSRRLR